MTEEKILTLRPDPKKSGRNIDKAKYDALKAAIRSLLVGQDLTQAELLAGLDSKLKGKFEGSIGWYGESVKLDLEARKLIYRTGAKPQKYRLVSTG